MSVAQYLGVERQDAPLLSAARQAWPALCAADADLAVVGELLELRTWGESASFDDRDRVHAALAKLAHFDGPDDQTAATAMTWVLLPGAKRIAQSIATRTDQVDGIVASNLWIAVKTANWERPFKISAAILNETRRYCLAELGIGSTARRTDPTWFRTDTGVDLDNRTNAVLREPDEIPPEELLRRLASIAEATGALAHGEIEFLINLAKAVEQHNGPAARGRNGLCTVAATTAIGRQLGITHRQVQRRAQDIVNRLRSVSTAKITRDALSSEPVIGVWSGEEVGQFGLDVLAHLGGVA